MKKASIIMAVLACAIIAAAYTNSVPISTNTRAATEKWTAIRFEPALPPTPANAESKFLNGNREWQTVAAEQDPVANAALAVHTNRTDNPHGVTAAQIGALTAEADLAALRTHHYGSPDIVESPSEWFTFDGAGTITWYSFEAGRENAVIPWEIGGVPVTAIGGSAFEFRDITSLIAPKTVMAIGDYAFSYCGSLTSVSLPQATSIGGYAFYDCASLTSVYMGRNAPAEAEGVFADITPPPTVYVTDPQATGWGAEWNGAPVVRPPLYGSNVTAQAYTLNGDTITEWPSGGETSIIAPLYESGTNITVTSTQSVYSVAVTNAGPVGIDWSGLALDGTGRAEVTLRINVTEWGGTNVTFSPLLTFDQTPEILVTGVWEFAASTIDGVTTRVRQTWPESTQWSYSERLSNIGSNEPRGGVGQITLVAGTPTNFFQCYLPVADDYLFDLRFFVFYLDRGYSFKTEYYRTELSSYARITDAITNSVAAATGGPYGSYGYTFTRGYCVAPTKAQSSQTGLKINVMREFAPNGNWGVFPPFYRRANANERAAYAAGWRP